MSRSNDVSEEMLHALIDGELEPVEAECLYARMGKDETLANRVCVLRGMKDMVRLAYSQPPGASRGWQDPFINAGRGWGQAIAAGLLLTTGLGAGWLMHAAQPPQISQMDPVGSTPVRLAAKEAELSKILLHIDSASPQKFVTLLDKADGLLKAARERNANLQVEVVANSHGLDLLRADRSPYARRIATLTENHENLRFIACAQTLARLSRDEGRIVLLPEAQVAPTAIGEIVDRLQQGWTYIKI